jgi:hypothetical protein
MFRFIQEFSCSIPVVALAFAVESNMITVAEGGTMGKLLFAREVADIEKKISAKAEVSPKVIVLVGVLTLAFLAVAITLFAMKQPEAGRIVIDLAVAFLAWSSGRASGEKAGLTHR